MQRLVEPLAEAFPKLGVPFRGPYNKDSSILGFILGSPYFGKLPHDSFPPVGIPDGSRRSLLDVKRIHGALAQHCASRPIAPWLF